MTDSQKANLGAAGKGAAAGAATGAGIGAALAPVTFGGSALAGAAIGAEIGGITGYFRSKAQQKRAKAAENTFQTPKEFKEAEAIAEGLANSGDPNTTRNQQAIDRAQANTISRSKALSGNVSDILNVLSSSQKTATDATLANMANDSAFRFNAKRNLANAKLQLGNANASTQGKNYNAVMAELSRQAQANQNSADSTRNMANDLISAQYLKKYGFAPKEKEDIFGAAYSNPYSFSNPFWGDTGMGARISAYQRTA